MYWNFSVTEWNTIEQKRLKWSGTKRGNEDNDLRNEDKDKDFIKRFAVASPGPDLDKAVHVYMRMT